MKRKDYSTPTMEVIKAEQGYCLLEASTEASTTLEGMGNPEEL